MEGIQFRPIDKSLRIRDQDLPAVFEGIDNHRARVAKSNLENRVAILPPPLFAHCRMVIAELGEVTCNWKSTWYLWYTAYVWDVGTTQYLSGCQHR